IIGLIIEREEDSVVLSFARAAMFFRVKKSAKRAYVQIVENKRVDGAVRQSVVATLGRADELTASGALASLLASGAKLTDQVLLINALDEDADGSLGVGAKRIGGPLLFGKLWERLGIGAALGELLKERAFEFAVERAVFVATLHRLFVSGSDRDCASWREDYDIPGAEGLDLHHFYRAMAWLGEEMEEKPADALAPRCVKDLIEEKLFDRRRDLFTDLSAVFMDTTSLSFYGEGGQTLGEHGYSKDYRPDLKQMILGLVVDGEGRPICTEMWPGNTADVTTLLPVVDRLRERFGVGRVCIVADRGMISAQTIAGLEERKLEYILGARERTDAIVKRIVLENDDLFVPLLVERKAGETQLFVKQVKIEGRRYIVCRNEAEAEKDRADREAIVAALNAQLKKGDKALIGNSAYRRYLRKSKEAEGSQVFQIDAGKLAEEARFDGIFVLRTNARITPLQAVLRYRDLLQVENLFLRTKAVMRTRPIFHSSDAAIRGHVFCSFLALTMQKHLDDALREGGAAPEWTRLLRDLDRLQQVQIRHRGADWLVRTDAPPSVANLFRAAQVALPPRARQAKPPDPDLTLKSVRKRRGRPRRSATSPRISPEIISNQ
ncbi:MAG TPA: IS1634 family transposase, partial [Methylocystis sp.]|nr:IS1634 family transposase [Methylocystis sp.]